MMIAQLDNRPLMGAQPRSGKFSWDSRLFAGVVSMMELVTLVGLAVAPDQGCAQTVPDAFVYTQCDGSPGNATPECSGPGSQSYAQLGSTNAGASSSSLYAADGSVTYYMQLAYDGNGTPSYFVPVFMTANGSASASGSDGVAEAGISVSGNSEALACAGYGGCSTKFNPPSFSGTITIHEAPGVHQITLNASAAGGPGGSASAYIDPYFQIDPAFLAQKPGYSLNFSAGVVNAASVLEPAAWLMACCGVVLLGVGRSRRTCADMTV